MSCFIAYFDLLGYKQFILNNSLEWQHKRAMHILRDVEFSLSQNKMIQGKSGNMIADLSHVKINCQVISDTVLFWTDNDEYNSLLEMLNVCYLFNKTMVIHNFPLRGVIIKDALTLISGLQNGKGNTTYGHNLIYGNGLLNAHIKAESLNWSGTVIEDKIVKEFWSKKRFNDFINKKTKLYEVPYKSYYKKEYALDLGENLNEISINNLARYIKDTFEKDNKSIDESAKTKLENTLKFLNSHL